MTSPNSVGEVSVEVVASVAKLARDLRSKVKDAFKGLDLGKAIQDSARAAKVRVPVEADTATFRASLAAAARSSVTAKVPVEPGDRAAYEAKLKAMLAAVSGRAKQNIQVDVDRRGLAGISGSLNPVRLVAGSLQAAFGGLAQSMQQSGNAAVQMGGSILGALSSAAGPIGAVVAGIVGVTAALAGIGFAATVAIPAVNALAGALAALPGLAAGIGAGVGTLALGFRGIAEAFKPKTGGGGGGSSGEDAAARARRVAAAERGVESARRGIASATRGLQAAERGYADALRGVTDAEARYAKAQQAVAKARREAIEDIQDLDRNLRGAKLSEEEAALAVTDALRELNEVRLTGNIPDIQAAELAYRRAQLTLEESQDTVGDLADQQADAAKKGVEGSDKVQSALEDEKSALQGVKDAQRGVLDAKDAVLAANDGLKASYDGLASAQDALASAQAKVASGGGGGGALKEVIKLAPAAQKFVDAIKALKPAFEDLRLDVQQRLFAGLDKTVTNLGNAWIPRLKTTLGAYATTFNSFFRTLGANVSTPEFMTRLQTAAEGARKGLDSILKAVSGPLVTAFGQLAEKSAPFLETLGTLIAGIVRDFSRWIDDAHRTGALQSFFTQASEALSDIFTTGKLVVKIVGQVFSALFQSGQQGKKSAIDSFNEGLQKVSDWLARPENQAKIRQFVDDLIALSQRFGETIAKVNDFLTPKGQDAAANSLGAIIGRALVAGVVAGIQESLIVHGQIAAAIVSWIVDKLKALFGIQSPSTVMAGIGVNLIDGLVKGIRDRLASARAAITGVRNTILSAASAAGSWLLNAGRNVVSGLVRGVAALYGSVRTAVGNLRAYAINAVSSAGSWLLNTGRNVVQGLWNGIASLSSWLYNRVASFARNYVSSAIRSALGVASPSKVTTEIGRFAAQGLAKGMLSEAGLVSSASDKLAAAAIPDVGADLLAQAGGGFGQLQAQLALAAPEPAQHPVLTIDRSKTGDKFLDALVDTITLKWNGDPIAALSPRR